MKFRYCYKILIVLLGLTVVAVPVHAQDEQAQKGQALIESLEVPEDQPDDPDKVKIIYFTSSSCDECLKVKKAMPALFEGFEEFVYIRKYDIDNSVENMAKLLTVMKDNSLGNDVAPPIMLIGKKVIVGDKKIIDTLQEVIISAITGEPIPNDPIEDPNMVPVDVPSDQKIPVTVPESGNIEQAPIVTDNNEPNDPGLDNPVPEDTALPAAEDANTPADGAGPKINQPEPIEPDTEASTPVQADSNETTVEIDEPEPIQTSSAEQMVIEQFEKFNLGAIAVAGLLDGVNPCAFTTIVFFISMLAYLGKSKRQIIIVGAGFTFAVFITYLLLGLGLLGAVKSFFVTQGSPNLSRVWSLSLRLCWPDGVCWTCSNTSKPKTPKA